MGAWLGKHTLLFEQGKIAVRGRWKCCFAKQQDSTEDDTGRNLRAPKTKLKSNKGGNLGSCIVEFVVMMNDCGVLQ